MDVIQSEANPVQIDRLRISDVSRSSLMSTFKTTRIHVRQIYCHDKVTRAHYAYSSEWAEAMG